MESTDSLDQTHPKPDPPGWAIFAKAVWSMGITAKTYCTSKEAAALLMVSPVTVREWTRKGLLRAVSTAGGHRRFLMEDLRAFASAHGIRLENDSPAAAGPKRVLLVDDDVVFATYLRQIILGANPEIQVQCASDGFEAGQLTESFRPQLVVLDIQMPRIDGIELCRRLRASPTTANAELIVMSNLLNEESVEAVRAAGANRWLEKGASRAEILLALGFGTVAAARAPARPTDPMGAAPRGGANSSS